MLGRFGRGKRNQYIDDAPIGFLFASGQPPASVHAIAEMFRHLTNEFPLLQNVEIDDPGPGVASLVVQGRVPLVIQWIDSPFPGDRLPEDAGRYAKAIGGHQHHIAVLSPGSELEPPEKLLGALTVIVMLQAAALCTRPHAVCWASSGGVYDPSEWTRGCTRYLRDDRVPVELLLRLITNTDGSRVYVSTLGMRLFGMRDIEVWDSTRSAADAREIAIDAVLDSIVNGEIAQRGKVWNWRVGPADFRARCERSVLEHREKVTALTEV